MTRGLVKAAAANKEGVGVAMFRKDGAGRQADDRRDALASGARAEDRAGRAKEVAYVQQFQQAEAIRADVIHLEVDLHPAGSVEQVTD